MNSRVAPSQIPEKKVLGKLALEIVPVILLIFCRHQAGRTPGSISLLEYMLLDTSLASNGVSSFVL
jgi:hypothetical protein